MTGQVARDQGYGSPRIESLLTTDDLETILRKSRRSIERLVAAGQLPAVKVGASTRFRPDDIRAFIDAHTQSAHERRPRGG